MATINSDKPLLVIVGPTASGKTALAIEIAREYDGEIICADSRTIYEGMDIGTAKPTKHEQSQVVHWGLDLVEPSENYSAADFKTYALGKIADIRNRGKMPILTGGTGLYIDGVIFDYQFGDPASLELRQSLEKYSLDELQQYCINNHINLPENSKNRRYLIRAIEQKSINTKRREAPIENSIIVGIATDKDTLRSRIEARTEQMFENDVVGEATMLGEKYGWNNSAMTGNIYPLIHEHLLGKLALEEVKEKFTTLDWRLAKRQLTWLRRNPYINWCTLTEAKTVIMGLLAPEQ